MSRRFIAPVTSRVEDKKVDAILRNHDERIRELAKLAQADGRRWRLWPGEALVIGNSANAHTRVDGRFIAGTAQNVFLPLENSPSESIRAIHGLVNAFVGPVTMNLRRCDIIGGSSSQVGPSDTSSGTGIQLLSVTGLGAQVKRDEFAAFDVRILLANTDQALAVVVETEPA